MQWCCEVPDLRAIGAGTAQETEYQTAAERVELLRPQCPVATGVHQVRSEYPAKENLAERQ